LRATVEFLAFDGDCERATELAAAGWRLWLVSGDSEGAGDARCGSRLRGSHNLGDVERSRGTPLLGSGDARELLSRAEDLLAEAGIVLDPDDRFELDDVRSRLED